MPGDQQQPTVVIFKKGGLGCGGLILALFALGVVASVVVKATRPSASTTPSSVAPLPGAAAPQTVTEPTPTVRRSFVRFGKGSTLTSCSDFTFEARGSTMDDAFVDNVAKGFVDPKAGDTQINKSCADQFPSNGILASCTTNYAVHATNDAGASIGEYEVQNAASYYDLDSLTRNDATMKKCMSTHGDWTGVDKKSGAYFDAVRARGRREVEQLQKTIGQATE
jgi:hypothetical protein